VASVPLTAEPWRPLAEGEVLIVQNGRGLSHAARRRYSPSPMR
jgi:hypothetical protein